MKSVLLTLVMLALTGTACASKGSCHCGSHDAKKEQTCACGTKDKAACKCKKK